MILVNQSYVGGRLEHTSSIGEGEDHDMAVQIDNFSHARIAEEIPNRHWSMFRICILVPSLWGQSLGIFSNWVNADRNKHTSFTNRAIRMAALAPSMPVKIVGKA